MSNQKPFIDPSLFTKPPPSFNKNSSSNWNNFKVPSTPNKNNASSSNISARNYSQETLTNYSTPPPKCYPPSPEPRKNYSQPITRSPVNLEMNYQTTPPPNASRNYKNEPPSSPDKNYKELVFNPVREVGQVQPFKPSVPPPQINKTGQSPQYDIKPIPAAQVNSLAASAAFDASKANYHLQMLIGLQQVAHFSNSLLSRPIASIQPPPPNYPPPQQPPLPPGAPPDVSPPPPPPVPLSSSNMCSLPQRGPSPGPIHLQNHHHMGNYHSRLSHPFPGYNQNFNKQMHYNLKRKYECNHDMQKKNSKKKKKPLSQVVPQRRDWSMEEARKALDVEKECNKRSKRQGLIIKFPDLELNRDIVTSFHTSIESVHFQQPSTPRYCFVTLSDSADPETVIKQLNQIPFGLGYLSAEFKKEREDEQNIKPTDIDPLTLYVGNLAQEITKEDMIKTFPNQKRIDIGYAKKMKYTRYAFVSFHTVNDAIDAFMKTHSSQMYSKSLIVRFRRLHGTVGMPGETKFHSNSRTTPEIDNSLDDTGKESNPWDIDVSHWENDHYLGVKYMDNHISEDEYDEDLTKTIVPLSPTNFQTRLSPTDHSFSLTRPGHVTVKEEKNDEFEEVIEYPVSNYGYREQFIGSETSKQDLQTVLGNIKQEAVKREEIKPENNEPVATRFRVIPQSIRRPSSSSTLANNFPENVTVKDESYYNKNNNTQSGSSNIQKQNSSIDTRSSIDDSLNSQKKLSPSSSETRDWNPDNFNTSSSIVPAPIIIKIEKDNIKEEILDSSIANEQILSDGTSVNNLISLNGTNGDVECDRLENDSVQLPNDGDNFSWMHMDSCYPAEEIKTELDEVDGNDENSSDDELTLDNILEKAKGDSSKKGR